MSFADQYPVLLASQESLQGLNQRLDRPVEMERFRPNVVVKGVSGAFAEDNWAAVSFVSSSSSGGVPFPPCGRCKVPTNDLATGELDPSNEPTKTMLTFRGGGHLGFSHRKVKNQVYFGIHLKCPSSGSGGKQVVSVGDRVLVRATADLVEREKQFMEERSERGSRQVS